MCVIYVTVIGELIINEKVGQRELGIELNELESMRLFASQGR